MTTMDNLFEGFRRHLKILRGLSEKSVNAYEGKVREFVGWLGEGEGGGVDFASVTRKDVENYLEACFYQGNSNHTRNAKLIALRNFFRYLAYEQVIPEDITRDVPRVKTWRTFVQRLTRDEVLRLFAAIDRDTEKGLRDTVVFILAAFCGLRAGEITWLRLSDIIDSGDGPLDINVIDGKHHGSRQVSLWKVPAQVLRQWLAVRIAHGAHNDDPVLVSYTRGGHAKGKPLTTCALDRLAKHYASLAGIKRPAPGIKMHMFRATHTGDLRHVRGYDIAAIAERLGHKHISTTDRYLPGRGRIKKTYRSLTDYWGGFGGTAKKEGTTDAD